MSTTMLMTAFFTHATELVKQLQEQFPDEKDLLLAKQSLWLISSSTSTGVPFMKNFYTYTSPFRKQIFDRDETFFLDLQFDESIGGSEQTLLKSLRIKELSSQMTQASKIALFKFFEGLLLLCEKLQQC
mgnify:CR=1 FL=1